MAAPAAAKGDAHMVRQAHHEVQPLNAPPLGEAERLEPGILVEDEPGRVTIAGKPSDDLAPGTFNSILKQAGLKAEEK